MNKAFQDFKRSWRTTSDSKRELEADCIWDASGLEIPAHVRAAILAFGKNREARSLALLRKKARWPELARFGQEVRHHLETRGYLLVKDFSLAGLNAANRRAMFLLLVSFCGTPVSHIPRQDKYVWRITPRKRKDRRFSTYSENNIAAPLHTDSHYRLTPEEFLAVLMERPAGNGGGKTVLLRTEAILKSLEETDEGRRYLDILRSQRFPSIIPSAYSKITACVESPIVVGKGIRFRPDTIELGIRSEPTFQAPELLEPLTFFSRLVYQSPERLCVALEKGDMLFINNYMVLHGRTAFRDKHRLLLRIRFNSRSLSEEDS